MSDRIKIDVVSVSLDKALKELQNKVDDKRPLMRQIAGDLLDAVEENFEQQGRPRWKALSESTIKQRRRRGTFPGKILQESGGLAASVTESDDENSAEVGTNKVYAAIHQFGGQAGRGKSVTIPARPFLSVTDEDLGDIEERVKGYIEG